jgi:hypothetical protein
MRHFHSLGALLLFAVLLLLPCSVQALDSIVVRYTTVVTQFDDEGKISSRMTTHGTKYIDAASGKFLDDQQLSWDNPVLPSNYKPHSTKLFDGQHYYITEDKTKIAQLIEEAPLDPQQPWAEAQSPKRGSGTDIIAGKKCYLAVHRNGTECIWRGLVLKAEKKEQQQAYTKIVAEVRENEILDASLFRVPEGFQVKTIGQMMDDADGQMEQFRKQMDQMQKEAQQGLSRRK